MLDERSNAVTVSVITTCKGRLHHLKQSLPRMLAQRCSFRYEVIVVDYGCPQNALEWCQSQCIPHVRTLRVAETSDCFSLSHARNCGARSARGRILAFVDADILLDESWLAAAVSPIILGKAGLTHVDSCDYAWDCSGTCAVSKEVFDAVRGYDERFSGWGGEEQDFYERCRNITTQASFSVTLLRAIQHGNDERVRHYSEKAPGRSASQNEQYRQQRQGLVNPEGYGLPCPHKAVLPQRSPIRYESIYSRSESNMDSNQEGQ